MKCPNCEAAMLKTAKHCSECGAKNPEFVNSDDLLTRHEQEIKDLKKRMEEREKKTAPSLDDQL